MKIATWNIDNIATRLPILLAWLDATKPDVVALQAPPIHERAAKVKAN